jgi:hypothetical protein
VTDKACWNNVGGRGVCDAWWKTKEVELVSDFCIKVVIGQNFGYNNVLWTLLKKDKEGIKLPRIF